MCCSVLQCVAVCWCSVCCEFQRVLVCCSVSQCCSVLQCVAVCCSVLWTKQACLKNSRTLASTKPPLPPLYTGVASHCLQPTILDYRIWHTLHKLKNLNANDPHTDPPPYMATQLLSPKNRERAFRNMIGTRTRNLWRRCIMVLHHTL